jgi:hypothetical protein
MINAALDEWLHGNKGGTRFKSVPRPSGWNSTRKPTT